MDAHSKHAHSHHPRTTMTRRLRRLRHDETGSWSMTIGLGFMAFFAATTLAIDVGMFMTARNQAQNAADAGALSGATAMVFNSYTNRSSTGPVVQSAMNTALSNEVISKAPSVNTSDVTFPLDPDTGQDNRVQVDVYRTAERGNPLNTMIGWIFGTPEASVKATAIAAVVPADAGMCVLPLTVPDRWIEKNCDKPPCVWSPDETFEAYDKKGDPLSPADEYIPPGQTGYTGYTLAKDKGLQLTLKNNNGNKVSPSLYNPWDLPGSVGGDDYRLNISGCNPNLVKVGHMMTPQNGNMVGPTQQGTDGLIASDPDAHWDEYCNCVKGSDFPISPRVRLVPLYDPEVYADGQQSGKSGPQLKVVNYLGFFIEEVNGGGDVLGRIAPILGKYTGEGPPMTGGFASAIMLVK